MTSPVPPNLPPLREVIRAHGLDALKSLGQNFLLDPRLLARIAGSAGDVTGMEVIEIGPGPGGLTRALLAAGASRVVAIERDDRCVAALGELASAYPGRLDIIPGDALAIDVTILTQAPRRIVANLPYNIATPLLIGWLKTINEFASLTLMFQREVAERLVARPGDDAYGRLGILTQWLTRPEILFDISPGAFLPPPKVTSSLVRLIPRPEPLAPAAIEDLEKVTAAAFGQRRKMLRSSLKSLGTNADALLEAAGVLGTRRAEELDITEFCALARGLAATRAVRN